MKNSIGLFVITVICSLAFLIGLSAANTQTVSQVCGVSGVMIRADSSVIIDGWRDYSANRMLNTANSIPSMEGKNAPSAIHLGKNLVNETIVCFEQAMGSHCVILEQLRKVK